MATTKKLYRNMSNKWIGGVCSGLGDYFNIDPVIIRLIFVVLVLLGGGGFLIYLVLLIVVPSGAKSVSTSKDTKGSEDEPPTYQNASYTEYEEIPKKKMKNKNNFVLGITLIFIGLLIFISKFIPYFGFRDILPIVLVIIGCVLLYEAFNANSLKTKKESKENAESAEINDKKANFNEPFLDDDDEEITFNKNEEYYEE